jgi:hypothetical protein
VDEWNALTKCSYGNYHMGSKFARRIIFTDFTDCLLGPPKFVFLWVFPIEYGRYIAETVIQKNYFGKMFRLSRKLCASTIIWCYVVFKNYQSNTLHVQCMHTYCVYTCTCKWWLSLLIRKPLKHFASWSENFAPIEECLLENISERLFASWSENVASRTIPAY